MKKLKQIFPVFLIPMIILSGCKKSEQLPKPVADFTYTGGTCITHCMLFFKSSSTNASSYHWDFGDGSANALNAEPYHQYENDGVYIVTLTVSNKDGQSVISKPLHIRNLSYTRAQITKITINAMPFFNVSGASWDSLNGPDVYLNLSDSAFLTMWGPSGNMDNIQSGDIPVRWNLSSPIVIENLYAAIFFDVYDNDFPDPEEAIGYVGLRLSDYMTTYPSTIRKNFNNVEITLDITWQ